MVQKCGSQMVVWLIGIDNLLRSYDMKYLYTVLINSHYLGTLY